MEKKCEIRCFGGAGVPHLREAEGGGESRTIEGYAIVFGVESVLLVDWYDAYREVIEPGAVTAEDLSGWDIKMTMWHNRERLLARSNKGAGTLRLEVDETGVKYSFEAPRTPDGETALELVRRGDLSGSSFTYWADENSAVDYTKDADGVVTRHVRRLGLVTEMTIAGDPAYTQTSVSAREVPEGLLGSSADGADGHAGGKPLGPSGAAPPQGGAAPGTDGAWNREIEEVRRFINQPIF